MAHQLNHHATLCLASVGSNGAWPLQAKNAANIPCKISMKRIPHPILCSVNGVASGTNVPAEKTATVPVGKAPEDIPARTVLGRSSFPRGFVFGTATSAYQIEGAWNEGGRGASIWDTFTHQQPGKIADKSNGDVATDAYHRYKEDIKIMKQMGVDSYRFSISWSRILPDGTLKGGVNQEGVDYYNNLIDELIKNGIKPFVTIFHWDVPQALEDKYGGFRDRRIVDDFKDYAKVCFQQFGDRVKHWVTLNEPWSFSTLGYSLGQHAPGRCSETLGCPVGDSLTEPYIVAHNLILAHGAAVRLYKDHFKVHYIEMIDNSLKVGSTTCRICEVLQRGEIGITLISMWREPYSNSYDDVQAAGRAMDFMLGWFMDPLVNGDYPFIMRALVRDRLPYFTKEESEMIKGSYDFIGLNYYTASYARSHPMSDTYTPQLSISDSYVDQLEEAYNLTKILKGSKSIEVEYDMGNLPSELCTHIKLDEEKDGVPIGKLEGTWIYVVPSGMKDLLVYTKLRYNNPKIYITENGTAQLDNHDLTLEQARADKERIEYMSLHLAQVRAAIQEGVNVKGYFAWSMTDNFEWNEGYSQRFGLTYIDFANDLKRYPKASSKWYTRFLES